MKFRRWASGFRQWKVYRGVLKRLRDMERHDPGVKANSTSKADLAWIAEGQHAADLIARACERYRDRPCLALREAHSDYRAISYSQLWQRALALADGLRREDWVKPGALVGLCGFSSVDWVVADLACLCLGAVTVPVDSSISAEDMAHVLRETGLSCLISEFSPLARLAGTLCESASLQAVLAMAVEGERPRAPEVGARWGWLDHVESSAEAAVTPVAPAGPDALFSVVYTSGSTGAPKGVMLTHGRWTQTLRDSLGRAAVPRLTVGYLPLSHMAGRINLYSTLMGGGCVSMVVKSDMSTLLDDIARARPTHLLLVPRVSGLLYQQFQHEMLRHGRLGTLDRMLEDPVGREVCRKMRDDLLGGRLCFVHVGAAPTPADVTRFLWKGLAVHVTDLYGSTEMGPVTVNGKVHDFVKYCLVDRPELGFTRHDKPHPRGELAIKSPRATSGYFNNPEATEGLFHDGYMLTGDIVEEVAPGQLVWLDRRQNVLRLAQGEFVNVSRLEELFCAESPFIDQCYLYGNAWHSYLLAVIVPSESVFDTAPEPAEQKSLLRHELARVASERELKGHEIPRDFLLERQPFTVENGLLSSANKPRRPNLKARFGPELEALYLAMEERQRSRLSEPGLPIEERLKGALTLTLGVESPDLDASFAHLGGDSLSALRLAELLSQTCGLEVGVADLLDPTAPLRGLLERVAVAADPAFERAHGKDATWANASDLAALLGASSEGAAKGPLAAPSVVLLTGASGFLGRFLALELASRLPEGGRVIALVRAKESEAARTRMRDSYVSEQAKVAFAAAESRLEILAGDLSRPHLGLDQATWERLGLEVDAIVHCGALVNHTLSYAHLFDSNVAATAELLALALWPGKPKAFHFVSTVGLGAGRKGRNPASEAESASHLWPRRPVDSQPGSYAQGYVTSKWAAEVLLEEAHRRSGLPVTISRCSLILPHSQWPGEMNVQDMLSRLLYGIWRTRLAPNRMGSGQRLDGLPVDLVAQFLAALAVRPAEGLRILHVCHALREGLSPDAVVGRAASLWSCETMEPKEFWPLFRARLQELPPDGQRLSPLPILERWEKGGRDELRLDNAVFLETLGELCPHWVEASLPPDYLDSCLLVAPDSL